jgi:hypothetical protein
MHGCGFDDLGIMQSAGLWQTTVPSGSMTALHEPVSVLLGCVLFSLQLLIAWFLAVCILGALERFRSKR